MAFLTAVALLCIVAPQGLGIPAIPQTTLRAPFSGTLSALNGTLYHYGCANWSDPVAPSFNFTNGQGGWELRAWAHSCGSRTGSEVAGADSVTVTALTWTANATKTVHVRERILFDWSLALRTIWGGNSHEIASSQAYWSLGAIACLTTNLGYCPPGAGVLSNSSFLGWTTGRNVTHGSTVYTLAFNLSVTSGKTYVALLRLGLVYDVEAFCCSGNHASLDFNVGSSGHRFGVRFITVT